MSTPNPNTHSVPEVLNYLLDKVHEVLDRVEGKGVGNDVDPADAGPANGGVDSGQVTQDQDNTDNGSNA